VGDQLGDAVVGIGHVGVGPHHHPAAGLLRADPPGRARTLIAGQQDGVDAGDRLEDLAGAVGRAVVNADQLVGHAGLLEGGLDALDLQLDVVALVVAGQHDRDVRDLGPARCKGRIHGTTPTECLVWLGLRAA
jgi:hypothetical protein